MICVVGAPMRGVVYPRRKEGSRSLNFWSRARRPADDGSGIGLGKSEFSRRGRAENVLLVYIL